MDISQHNNNNNNNQAVQATPVVIQHWQPRQVTSDEKRCCCTCTRATVCVFIVMLCIGGGALIGTGTAELIIQAARYNVVQEYNDAVATTEVNFPSGSTDVADGLHNITVSQMVTGSSSTVSVYTAVPAHHTVTPIDSAWDVDKYTSYVFTAIVPQFADGSVSTFKVNPDPDLVHSTSSESITVSFPSTKTVTEAISCTLEACVENCDDHRECSKESLQSYCVQNFGADATYQGDDKCYDDDTCGSCTFLGHLERVCIVLEEKMYLGFNHHLDSCYYPFKRDSQVYGPRTTASADLSVKVDFRSASDPFIVMQRVTEGSMSFGHPTRIAAGGALLVIIGISLIVIPSCAMCCYRFCFYQVKKNSPRRPLEERDGGASHNDEVLSDLSPRTITVTTQAMPDAYPVPTNGTVVTNALPLSTPNPMQQEQQPPRDEYTHAQYEQQPQQEPTPYGGTVPEDGERRLFGSRSNNSTTQQQQQQQQDVELNFDLAHEKKPHY